LLIWTPMILETTSSRPPADTLVGPRVPRWLVSFAVRNTRDSVATETELQVGNSRPGAIDDTWPL
jgi:hypothetical protein